MAHFLFISSSTLAANPRFVKAFEACKDEHTCTVVCFTHQDWGEELSKAIVNRNSKVNFLFISYHPNFIIKVWAKLLHKTAILLNSLAKNNKRIAAYANSDKTFQLHSELKNKLVNRHFDVMVVHNVAAFYPAIQWAKKTTKISVDIEDYHPGEESYFNQKNEICNRLLLMKSILQRAWGVSYASPLIMQECLHTFNEIKYLKGKSIVVQNCFPQHEFQYKDSTSEKLKLVWFSQNIASGRGLEQLLAALVEFEHQVELHLIGNLSAAFHQEVLQHYASFIVVHPPKPQLELHQMLAEYDIGLCLEQGHCLNNKLALSNKIWAYFQSGLFIYATDTPAQQAFIKTHPKHGICIQKKPTALTEGISYILQNKNEIRKSKKTRFDDAKSYSWEKEVLKLKTLFSV